MVQEEILKDFKEEANKLITQLIDILEKCEGDFTQVKSLEKYGQLVDRIMGAAKSIALQFNDSFPYVAKVGDYSALCKAVGYKASQIKNNPQFYEVCVALLFDATEMLEELVENLEQKDGDFQGLFSRTFLERLRWVSGQFDESYRSSLEIKSQETAPKMAQNEIDTLLRKLGL